MGNKVVEQRQEEVVSTRNKPIRSVNELEDLRVQLSEQIQELLRTGTSRAVLNRIKELKQQIIDVKDELHIAKNLEVDKAKHDRLAEADKIRTEAKQIRDKARLIAQELLPLIEEGMQKYGKLQELSMRSGNLDGHYSSLHTELQQQFGIEIEHPLGLRLPQLYGYRTMEAFIKDLKSLAEEELRE